MRGDISVASTDDDAANRTLIMAPSEMAGHKKPAPRARLVCRNPNVLGSPAGQEILLDGGEVTIGRGSDSAVSLKADGISRHHAKVFPGDSAWGVEDLGSTNGVVVNGTRIKQTWLKPGDVMLLGTVEFEYGLVEVEVPTEMVDAMREAEKTVVMRPTVKREVTGEVARTTGATTTRTATRTASKPPPPKPSPATPAHKAPAAAAPGRPTAPRQDPKAKKSGSGMLLIVALLVVVVAAVGYALLG